MAERTPRVYGQAEGYADYHREVVAAIKDVLAKRWPDCESENSAALMFFDCECTYDAAFAESRDPIEVAEEEVEAACDSE